MPDAAPAEKAPPVQDEAPTSFELTVTEFCARKSGADSRVELVSAFHADEARQGRVKGTEAEHEARFVAFANRPA